LGSLLGGLVAIVLGIIGLSLQWYGQYGITYLLKALVAVIPALLVIGGAVAIGAGFGSIKDRMREKKEKGEAEEKKEEPAKETKAEEKKSEEEQK